MADDKLAQKRNTSGEPVKAEPNHVREKTYEAPNSPERIRKEEQALPESTARDKVRDEMPEAARRAKDEARKRQ